VRRDVFVINEERGRVRKKRDLLVDERDRLEERQVADPANEGVAQRLDNLLRGIEVADEELDRLHEEWQSEIRAGVASGRYTTIPAVRSAEPAPLGEGPEHVLRARDQALRSIARHEDLLDGRAGERLEALVRRQDPHGLASRYLAAVGSPHYSAAFGKLLADPVTGHLRFGPEEVEAVRAVGQVEFERSLATGTGSAGGFAVPMALDPTVILTSDGALNPLRQISRVETIESNEWRAVTSAGVTATFSAEAAEATDDSPTLVQPSIFPERVLIWVPFSFEIGQDWRGIQTELARLFADAKDVLEADKFLFGTGHANDEPEGLLYGLDTPDDGSPIVETASIGAFVAGDVFALQAALPARWQPRASFVSSLAMKNRMIRFETTTEPALFNDARDRLLSKPFYEASDMSTSVAGNEKLLVYGDFSQFAIVDRIGLTIELVPHLFGASQRPTGQRGLLAWFRTSSGILTENAFKVLESKAS
jgi:HK97 family phage major capsid protein